MNAGSNLIKSNLSVMAVTMRLHIKGRELQRTQSQSQLVIQQSEQRDQDKTHDD